MKFRKLIGTLSQMDHVITLIYGLDVTINALVCNWIKVVARMETA